MVSLNTLLRSTLRSPRSPKMNSGGPANDKSSPVQQDEEPQRSRRALFPIVGVGASAGGLEAFTQFLKALGAGAENGGVICYHLSPRPKKPRTRQRGQPLAITDPG